MSAIKRFIHERDEEEQALWESYLEWVGDNRDLWEQLPKNITEDFICEE